MRKITIQNKNQLKATFTNYGARLMNLWVPDSKGQLKDIVLGFDEAQEYKQAEEQYFGATVGRYANRISKGVFFLNKNEYNLALNNPPNHLHGGIRGLHTQLWDIILQEENRLVMSYHSNDMEEGYPGNLQVEVSFHLTNENALSITYKVNTDKLTPINLTHHSYFNLKGEGDILNHLLMISAQQFTPVNTSLIPTGKYQDVKGTPFDFIKTKRIGEQIDSDNPQMKLGKGYDHNFVLKKKNSSDIIHAATVTEPESGRIMEVHTNQPGMQFYTANWFSGNDTGKSNTQYQARAAFCLETQHFPDSPNQSHFPSCILHPEDTYEYCCKYIFKTQ